MLSSLSEVVISYFKDTSVSLASIIKSKYPSVVGAITEGAISSLPAKIGVITLDISFSEVISLLLTSIFHLATEISASPVVVVIYLA